MLASRWKVPSVLFLIASGVLAKQVVHTTGMPFPDPSGILPVLGLLGLALIVLEGSLELRIKPGQGILAMRATLSAAFGIALFTLVAGAVLHHYEGSGWRLAFLNAIPLSVISSAIAIPSASRLPAAQRDFVALESSISDIIGVLAFNALLMPHRLGFNTLARMGANAVITLALSLLVCGVLIMILGRTTHKVRFFPLLAGLILSFSLGKHFHLSSLLLLLCFGLVFANLDSLPFGKLRRFLVHPKLDQDAHLLETLVGETTFLARTFFFFLFGYSLVLDDLTASTEWAMGFLLLTTIYATRSITLLATTGGIRRDLLFLAPRGLVSVLLYGAIALDDRSALFGAGALLLVVLGSSFLQVFAGRDVATSAQIAIPPVLADHLGIGERSRHKGGAA